MSDIPTGAACVEPISASLTRTPTSEESATLFHAPSAATKLAPAPPMALAASASADGVEAVTNLEGQERRFEGDVQMEDDTSTLVSDSGPETGGQSSTASTSAAQGENGQVRSSHTIETGVFSSRYSRLCLRLPQPRQ